MGGFFFDIFGGNLAELPFSTPIYFWVRRTQVREPLYTIVLKYQLIHPSTPMPYDPAIRIPLKTHPAIPTIIMIESKIKRYINANPIQQPKSLQRNQPPPPIASVPITSHTHNPQPDIPHSRYRSVAPLPFAISLVWTGYSKPSGANIGP